ncbi:uPF0340 protein CLOBOL_05239 [Acidaminococcus sp. CAG:917]|nr:uPF0340 protein CLOBOL_05239 [Acidaminococcus sp. CAG:917]
MDLKEQIKNSLFEIIELSKIKKGQILLIGCSTSEVSGFKIGSHSAEDVGYELAQTALDILNEKGIYIAAQCCEHLNRAVVVSREAISKFNLEEVNVVPWLKGGGSFATATYKLLGDDAAVVETIKADAGLDIGAVMIGMRLKEVAVPVRLKNNKIGEAAVSGARVRPKFIGGERAKYNEDLK